jgi:molecular chaperone GrpE
LTDNQSAAGEAAGDEAAATELSHSVDEQDRIDHGQSGGDAPANEIDALKAEAQENWNKYLRSVAELENLRKRNARDVENARNYGIERLVGAILPVRDSLEAALKAATDANEDAIEIGTLIEGDRATLRLLDQALDDAGIAEINPEGEPFDPQCHEAISLLPSATAEPNSVITVVQKGFSLHGRVVRPARVVVAQAPLGNDNS